jgi:hypothetical protein
MLPPLLIIGLFSLGSLAICIFRRSQIRSHWHASYWFIFTQLLFYPLAIAVGVLFPAASTSPFAQSRSNSAGEHLLDALTLLSLVTASFWVYRMKGLRWLAGSLAVLQEVVVWGALLIAGMSVTGDWL